jgi:formylglycine-generating enzyme required for sulfatase activity
MGDNRGRPNERPEQVVNIDYDYYIDKYEVTNEQYRAFCNGSTGRTFPQEPEWDPSYSSKPDHPVAGVSWDDARAYCQEWAGKRLPTEAEWEKAASWDPNATDSSPRWKRRWPWGNTFDPARVSFNARSPRPVGQFPAGASAYEVYDMAGNLGEWIEDIYNAYPGNSASDPNYNGVNRVLRSGTFIMTNREGLRTAYRSYGPPTFTSGASSAVTAYSYIGFRCAVRSDDPRLQEQLKRTNR